MRSTSRYICSINSYNIISRAYTSLSNKRHHNEIVMIYIGIFIEAHDIQRKYRNLISKIDLNWDITSSDKLAGFYEFVFACVYQ